MPEISVIIPVFNASKYLKECLESLLSQSFTDFEVICINDGSTDNSLEILQHYQKQDDRIKIISQKNQGVSVARNVGLDIVKGQFIAFLDADDQLFPHFFDKMLFKNLKADLSVCGYYGNQEMKFETCNFYLKEVESDFFINLLKTGLLFSPWGKIYSNEIIKKHIIRFPKNINFGEDLIFNVQYLEKINSISVISEILYCYNTSSSDSLSKKINKQRFTDIDMQINFEDALLSKLFSRNVEINHYIMEKYYWNVYDACLHLFHNFDKLSNEEKYSWINHILQLSFFNLQDKKKINANYLVQIFYTKNQKLIKNLYTLRKWLK